MNTTHVCSRRQGLARMGLGVLAWVSMPAWLQAQTFEAPEALIERVAGEVIELVKADAALRGGDMGRIMELVDTKIMPHVNFTRMTASTVGRFWRQASPEQRQRLQEEFKLLLIRTYSGALGQLTDQTLVLRPMRSRPEDTEVVVRSELRGRGEPIQIDYRMEKTADGWKVFDINVLGIWLVETYRGQFAQEINARGIDGLIAALAERNRGTGRS
ncbi:ABC transporter substrate-binding protein [Tepidicella baoligensis]|uniref:MlaC/ttg2D family ABC transporter substrate-binding protein n=1 Tax=Tepidicella baoligensis TaxID=2707016 RepID=UPI0015DAC869